MAASLRPASSASSSSVTAKPKRSSSRSDWTSPPAFTT